jgi:Domain of unknown function (DUF5615)
MVVKFQADADLNQDIVTGLLRREPTIDFQTADAAGLLGLPDLQVLELAANEGRIVISHERRTMPKWFAEFINTKTSAGLLIVPQDLPLRDAIEDLFVIWAVSNAEEWVNRIASIPI